MALTHTPKYVLPAFLLTLALILLQAVYDHQHVASMHRDLDHLSQHHSDKQQMLQEIRSLVRDRMAATSVLMLHTESADEAALYRLFERSRERFLQLFGQSMARVDSDEERQALQQMMRLVEEVGPVCDQTVAWLREGRFEAARELYFSRLRPGHESLLGQTEQIQQLYLKEMESDAAEMHVRYEQGLRVMNLVAGGAILGVVGIGLWLIRRLRSDRQRLEQGNALLEEQVEIRTRELSEANQQLLQAQRVGRMGHWEWDIASGSLHWSDEIYRIFGVDADDYRPSYDNFLATIHEEDRGSVVKAVERALQGEPYAIEHRILRPGGNLREVLERGVVHYEGDLPVRMLGTVHDITERKQVEHELRLAGKVFENTGDGVMIADSDNRILNANGAFLDITGYSLEEVRGQDPRLLKSGRHDEAFYQAMWHAIEESGQWQGEIWDRHKEGHVFPVWMTINAVYDEHGALSNYVGIFRDITQIKQTEQQLWHIAHHDPLCDLPNRSLMYARLQLAMTQADRESRSLAFMLLDLDGFKEVNDTLGHEAGDQVLLHVAKALREVVRESDTVARHAGDEFTVLLGGLKESRDADAVANKLLQAIGRPLIIDGQSVQIGASIGIALYPTDSDQAEQLIARADQAMYRAKRSGKNRYCYFA